MKKILFITISLMCSLYLLAQAPFEKTINGKVSARIYGKITDSSGIPVADA